MRTRARCRKRAADNDTATLRQIMFAISVGLIQELRLYLFHVVMVVSAIHEHMNCLLLRRNVASVATKLTCYFLFLIDCITHLHVLGFILRIETDFL